MKRGLLALQLAMRRLGWSYALLSLLALSCLYWGGVYWKSFLSLQHAKASWAQTKEQLVATEELQSEKSRHPGNLVKFRQTLVDSSSLEDILASVFKLAREHQVALPVGSYKVTQSQLDDVILVKLALPTQAAYAALRNFSEAVLTEHPYISLDLIDFSRKEISSSVLDSQVEFSIYLKDSSRVRPQGPTAGVKEAQP